MTANILSDAHCTMLRPGTSASAVVELAATHGWELVADEPRTFHQSAVRKWRVPAGTDGADEMELVEDHVGGFRVIKTPDSIRVLVAEALPMSNVDELFEQAGSAQDPLARMRALRALQYCQIVAAMHAADRSPLDPDEPHLLLIADDERYLAVFRLGLDDSEPGVRRAAVDGLCRSFYPGALSILREYRDHLPEHVEEIDWHLDNGPYRIKANDDR